MKYYLIKCEEGIQDNLSFLYNALGVKDNTEKVISRVELTEEDIHTLWDSCQTAIYECSPGKEPPIQSVQGKIRKVLE